MIGVGDGRDGPFEASPHVDDLKTWVVLVLFDHLGSLIRINTH